MHSHSLINRNELKKERQATHCDEKLGRDKWLCSNYSVVTVFSAPHALILHLVSNWLEVFIINVFFPPPANKQLSFTALRYCLFLLVLREHIYLTLYFSRKSQTDLCVLPQRGSPSYSCSYSYIHTRERHSANTLSYCRPPRSSAGQMAPNQKSEVTAAHQRRGEGRVQV